MRLNPLRCCPAIAISLILTFLVLYPLIDDGMAVTSDSVKYINMARNLLQGNGISMLGCKGDLRPNTHWAPLFGCMLALPVRLGLHWMEAARFWTLLSYFTVLVVMFFLVYRLFGSLLYALIAQFIIGLHPILLKHSGSILTEPVAWVILAGILWLVFDFLQRPRHGRAIGIGVLLGVALLLRFAFLGILPGLALLMILSGRRIGWKKSFFYSALTSALALLPFLLWYVRNIYVGSGFVDEGTGGNRLLFSNAWVIALNGWKILLGFFSAPQTLPWLVLFPLIGIGVLFFRRFKRFVREQQRLDLVFGGCLMLMAGYGLTMLMLRTFSAPVSLDGRMFSPFIFLLLLMGFCLCEWSSELKRPARYPARGGLALWALWMVVKGGFAAFQLQERPLYYAAAHWKQSETLRYVLHHFDPDELLCSDPEPFWLYHNICVHRLPLRHVAPQQSQQYDRRAMVWFDRNQRPYIVSPEDIEWGKGVRHIELSDGDIYWLN